jgi:hypothetical protein
LEANVPSTLISRIEARLRVLGIPARAASRSAGFNPGYIGDVIRGKSRKGPQLPGLQKIAEALACDVEYLMGSQTIPRRGNPEIRAIESGVAPIGLIPLHAGTDFFGQWFDMGARSVARVASLPSLALVEDAYALTVPNDFMAPRYLAGEVVYLNPVPPPRAGDFVVARRTDNRSMIAQIESVDAAGAILILLNPGSAQREHIVAREDLEILHRIVGSTSG